MTLAAPSPLIIHDLRTPLGLEVRFVTLNRPERRNSLDGETLRLLSGAVTGASDRILLLTASPPTFCAGMDLFFLQEVKQVPGGIHRAIESLVATLKEILRHPKPTIAFVDGAAIGGGLGLALAFDLIYATPDSEFCLPGGALQSLARLVHPLIGRRKIPAWDGMRIGVKEAERLGIINGIMDADRGLADPTKFVESVLRKTNAEGLVRDRPPFDAAEMSTILDDAFRPETEEPINRFLDGWVAEQATRLT